MHNICTHFKFYMKWTEMLNHKQLVLYPKLSAPSRHLQGKIHALGTFFSTSVISFMVSHFDYKHRCHVEKNVPIALILPSRWQNGAESLGREITNCQWLGSYPLLNHGTLYASGIPTGLQDIYSVRIYCSK